MSEKQKEILSRIGAAMPKLEETDQMYILGQAEARADLAEQAREKGGEKK